MRLVVLSLLLAVAMPAWSAPLCRLESVELRQDDSGTWLELRTDQPANFTSFKLGHPTRILVDFPEVLAPDVPNGTAPDGPVKSWVLETLGEDASPVVRLTVELREEADYTLLADGTRLQLRLLPATGRPLVALDGRRVMPEPPPVTEPEPVVIAEVTEPEPVVIAEVTEPEAVVMAEAPEPEPVVIAEAPEPEPVVVAEAPVAVDEFEELPALASLEQISFRRTARGARIVLRTSLPVSWALAEDSDSLISLVLEGTHIPAAPNRLPLDTRYFGTPVLRVMPSVQRAQRTTRIAVELGAPARWSAFLEGGDLVLEVAPKTTRPALAGGETW